MPGTKEAVVLRLLRSEDMDLVSRETGFALHEIKGWLDQYKRGGLEALKRHPRPVVNAELEQARQLIAKQALEIEILKKAKALAASRQP
jgi:transposase-like protein